MCECLFKNCPINCTSEFYSCANINNELKCIKNDFFFNSSDIILVFVIFFTNIFCSLVGVGGGGILLPVYMILANFSISYAIPHTVLNIMFSSLIRLIILFNKKHNISNKRFLIDFSIILILVPFDGNLSYIGYILNFISPNVVILAIIILLLSFINFKLMKKYISECNLEKDNIIKYNINGISKSIEKVIKIEIEDEVLKNIKKWFSHNNFGENKLRRYFYLLIVFLFSLLFFGLSFFRTKFKKCSNSFIIYNILSILFTTVLSIISAIYVYKQYKYRKDNKFKFIKGDIDWSINKIIKFSLFGTFTGIISTFLGIGGGILVSPFLLFNNVLQEVIVSTNSVSTFFSSSISTSQYIFTGQILPYYGIVTSIASMIGSFIGINLNYLFNKKYKKKSLLTLVLFIITFISEILLIIKNINSNSSTSESINFCK
jgi:uncharacterized membrane protein YfcA